MKRLVLRYRAPDAADGKVEEYKLGDKRPSHLVIVKATGIVRNLSLCAIKRLAGSPIIVIPPGSEFELWEVEQACDIPGDPAKVEEK